MDKQVVKVTGVPTTGKTMTVLMRGSNRLVLDEAERSVHDALCVVRSLVSTCVCMYWIARSWGDDWLKYK